MKNSKTQGLGGKLEKYRKWALPTCHVSAGCLTKNYFFCRYKDASRAESDFARQASGYPGFGQLQRRHVDCGVSHRPSQTHSLERRSSTGVCLHAH